MAQAPTGVEAGGRPADQRSALARAFASLVSPVARGDSLGDRLFRGLSTVLAFGIVALVIALLIVMVVEGMPVAQRFGLSFLTSTSWNPVTQQFGVLPAIYGTVISSLIGLVIAVPVGLGAAIFLAEFAPAWVSRPLSFLIELLAAIPSVVIGLWGLLVMVPAIEPVETSIANALGFLPIFSGTPLGVGMLTAGLILAVMVLPILTAVTRDVILAVPRTQREAMLALGATEWEAIIKVVVPYGQSGIIGAIILGLGRAMGETLAVTMLIGNAYQISPSLFAPATTLASLIASQFREADSQIYLSALIAAGVVLFFVAVVVNVLARLLVWSVGSRQAAAVGGGA